MEILGGFMVMMSILGLFLAVVWLIMPFVVFAMKGKQDRTLEVLESMDRRLKAIELQLEDHQSPLTAQGVTGDTAESTGTPEPVQLSQPAVLPLA